MSKWIGQRKGRSRMGRIASVGDAVGVSADICVGVSVGNEDEGVDFVRALAELEGADAAAGSALARVVGFGMMVTVETERCVEVTVSGAGVSLGSAANEAERASRACFISPRSAINARFSAMVSSEMTVGIVQMTTARIVHQPAGEPDLA